MNKKLIFFLVFSLLGLTALQVPINQIIGSQAKFTIFDLLAPTCGAFLGSTIGIIAVFAIQLINLLIHGVSSFDRASVMRLLPMLFGVWFFAVKDKRGKWLLIVPALSIIAFNLHPQGRAAWFYSLFWLIPFIVWPLRERFLIAKSLGATFVVHSVGSAFWIWAFNLPSSVWASLVPVTILERSIFALGISASYIFLNNVLGFLSFKKLLPAGVQFSKKYLLKN